ncbi:MAG TPA: DUF4136 domain-containing protein [Nitrospira sp.]|nr:DUF4136 domain-containing protein [Nitrospira sp.]
MAGLSVLMLCACAPNITVDYDKNVDFSKYRTYAWGKGTPAKNPNLDRQIIEAVDDQLARKGFTKTDGDPDLVVAYHAATHEEIDENPGSPRSGYGPAYGSLESISSGDTPMRVRVGTIAIDLYDTKDKRNVWHATGSDIVEDTPEKTAMEIRKGAAKMFEKFPGK